MSDIPPLLTDDPEETHTIRVLTDVGEVFSVDGEMYSLSTDDIVELPSMNAQRLVEADAAEVASDAPPEPERDEQARDGDLLLAAMGDKEAADRTGLSSSDTNGPEGDSGEDAESLTARPTSALPIGQLEALDPDQRRRYARRRGLDIPATSDVRDRLGETINQVLREQDRRVVEAPTGVGKTYAVAATRWDAREDVTGDRRVVHLLPTTDARDDAAEIAEANGGEFVILRSRDELCPVAAGDCDPRTDGDRDDEYQPITIDNEPASAWIDRQCDQKGVPFSAAHSHLADHNDQGVELPCGGQGDCPAIHQYERLRSEDPPLVIATHQFAHVPSLRHRQNVVFDERPDFTEDLSTGQVRRAISAFLSEVNAPVETWEAFVQLSQSDSYRGDLGAEVAETEERIERVPDREWFIRNPDAHTLAPALARAVWHAESRGNGRRHGKVSYEPPRLDASASGDDLWNREYLSVVLDEDNDICLVRSIPDLSTCRSLVGLDAHPSLRRWRLNTWPDVGRKKILDDEERALWRRFERGLRVIQVGEATRPLSSGEYYDSAGIEVLIEHLSEKYGEDFRTAITSDAVERRVRTSMEVQGIENPKTMHFGNTASRNDFDGESVGLVNGCIDPGDEFVLDLLAELNCEAEPSRAEKCCEHCGDRYDAPEDPGEGCEQCDGTGMARAHGREFDGPDADTAAGLLASVRQSETAQATGRWARSADDPADTATVYVRTDVLPDHMVDATVPGTVWTYGKKQSDVVKVLRNADSPLSARQLASRADCTKEHVRETLARLAPSRDEELPDGVTPREWVHAVEGAGEHGATLYSDDGTPTSGVADVELATETANSPVWDYYTWTLAITDPSEANRHGTVETDHGIGETRDDVPGHVLGGPPD